MNKVIFKLEENIYRFLFYIPLLRNVARYIYYHRNRFRKIWGGGILEDEINCIIEKIASILNVSNTSLIRDVKNDMIDCYVKYGATPQEYFLFGFRNASNKQKKKLLTNKSKDILMIKKVGLSSYHRDLRDKYKFYQIFETYFLRDVCKVDDSCDKQKFSEFVIKHQKYIIKPIDGMCGQGAEIRKCCPNSDSIEEEFKYLLRNGKGWIIEEIIDQDTAMAEWNKSSVNTVRIPSFINSEGFHILKPFFRTGRSGQIVDNAACGGIFAVIDEKSGVIITDGFDELGEMYIIHPDSHLRYKGWVVPRWEELILLAKSVHEKLPNHSYIGWDFALTSKGWVLIEGDWGQFLSEIADHEGIKDKFKRLIYY